MSKSNPLTSEITEAFDLNQRRKFVLKHPGGKSWDLYFKPVTRSDQKKAMQVADSVDGLDLATQLVCQCAEQADGSKAFGFADAKKLQDSLPLTVLNEMEAFLLNVELPNTDEVKNS